MKQVVTNLCSAVNAHKGGCFIYSLGVYPVIFEQGNYRIRFVFQKYNGRWTRINQGKSEGNVEKLVGVKLILEAFGQEIISTPRVEMKWFKTDKSTYL